MEPEGSDNDGELSDEFARMSSAEAAPQDGAVIVCGADAATIFTELFAHLITNN